MANLRWLIPVLAAVAIIAAITLTAHFATREIDKVLR